MMRLHEDSVLLSPPQSPYSREVQLAEKPTSTPRDAANSDALANALAVTLNSPVLSQNALSSIRDSAEWSSERVFATPPPTSEKRVGEDTQLRDVKRPKLMREPSLQQVPVTRPIPTSAPVTLSGHSATFSSTIFTTIARDPAAFRRREDAFLDFYQRAPASSMRSYNNAASAAAAMLKKRAAAASSRAASRRSDDGGYSSNGSVTRSMTSSRARPQRVLPQRVREVANAATSAKPRSASPAPSTPRATPSPKKRVVAPPSSSPAVPSRVHDTDYAELADYCPSTDTLPASGRPLKAEWKGAPMDLSDDPMLDKLHPAEVYLASCLRLSCDTYLDSKRRLFAEKVHRLKFGLPFRRTDSQKACRIDVNKASRLFSAYEKVGWLEDGLFKKFL